MLDCEPLENGINQKIGGLANRERAMNDRKLQRVSWRGHFSAILLAGAMGCPVGCGSPKDSASDRPGHVAHQDPTAPTNQKTLDSDRLSHAKALLKQGEVDEALGILSALVESGSNDPEVFVIRAEAYDKRQQLSLEVADYSRAIALRPEQVEWRLQRAIAYLALNRFEMAKSDCDDVIHIAPDSAAAFAMRAAVEVQQGDYIPAIRDCNEALRLQPHFFAAFSNRGLAFLKLDRLPEAVADLTEAIRLNNTSFEAYLNRGACYERLGKDELALADWTAAIEQRSGANLAYANRAHVNVRLGHFADAIADYTTLIEAVKKMPAMKSNDPRLPRATLAKLYLERGRAHLANGSPADALADAKSSAEMGGDETVLDTLRQAANKRLAAAGK